MPRNSYEQLKMSKKFGGSQRPFPPPNPQLGKRASLGDPQFLDFFFLLTCQMYGDSHDIVN